MSGSQSSKCVHNWVFNVTVVLEHHRSVDQGIERYNALTAVYNCSNCCEVKEKEIREVI